MTRNPARDAAIVKRFRDGESARGIAASFGISHQRVYAILEREGNPEVRSARCGNPACGRHFQISKGKGRRPKYCSHQCRRAAYRSGEREPQSPAPTLTTADGVLVVSGRDADGGSWVLVYHAPDA